MLNECDWELERRGHRFVRYADDLMIFCKSKKGTVLLSPSMPGKTREVWQALGLDPDREPPAWGDLAHTRLAGRPVARLAPLFPKPLPTKPSN